ncbi:flagellar hook associated protein [Bdellovibrio sp. qaytius]|nr:flagellar hook associated protein [Bdellovibrio sp. qaytius]
MGIHVSGLGGGGLPPNLVDQVIEAERMPLKKMEADKAKIEDKVKLVTEFETKINDILKNLGSIVGARGFSDMKFVSGFPDIIEGQVDPSLAESGDWNVEVLQLATKPSIVSNGAPDKDQSSIGVGYIKFDTADGIKEVYIDAENSTLDKVAAKINESDLGVRANVINDRKDKVDCYRLQLTGAKTGDDHTVDFPTVYMVDGDFDFEFDEKLAAKNAKFKLNGHEFESAENKVTDAIPGVTLDLKQVREGVPVKLTVTENYDVIGEKVKSFVDSYNGALTFIQGQNKLTQTKEGMQRLGPLGGDSMLRMTEGRLRRIIQDVQDTNSSYERILELGVEFNRNGTLDYKADKFKKAVAEDPRDVIEFLRGNLQDTGFVTNMRARIREITDPTVGAVGNRKTSMQRQVTNIDQKIERKEKSLEKREESLRRQFANMEEAMSKMQSQGASLGKG